MTQRKAVVLIDGAVIGGSGQSLLKCRTFNNQTYVTENEGKLTKADVEKMAEEHYRRRSSFDALPWSMRERYDKDWDFSIMVTALEVAGLSVEE